VPVHNQNGYEFWLKKLLSGVCGGEGEGECKFRRGRNKLHINGHCE